MSLLIIPFGTLTLIYMSYRKLGQGPKKLSVFDSSSWSSQLHVLCVPSSYNSVIEVFYHQKTYNIPIFLLMTVHSIRFCLSDYKFMDRAVQEISFLSLVVRTTITVLKDTLSAPQNVSQPVPTIGAI